MSVVVGWDGERERERERETERETEKRERGRGLERGRRVGLVERQREQKNKGGELIFFVFIHFFFFSSSFWRSRGILFFFSSGGCGGGGDGARPRVLFICARKVEVVKKKKKNPSEKKILNHFFLSFQPCSFSRRRTRLSPPLSFLSFFPLAPALTRAGTLFLFFCRRSGRCIDCALSRGAGLSGRLAWERDGGQKREGTCCE